MMPKLLLSLSLVIAATQIACEGPRPGSRCPQANRAAACILGAGVAGTQPVDDRYPGPISTDAGAVVVQVSGNEWYSPWKFVYVAKRYVQDHKIAFELSDTPPSIYVYTSHPVMLAQVYLPPKNNGPLLIVSIGKSGRAYKHEFVRTVCGTGGVPRTLTTPPGSKPWPPTR